MKYIALVFSMVILTLGMNSSAHGQSNATSETVQPGFLNVHVTQNTTREELAQLQKDMSAINIGFRYDMINWVDGKLQSIRFGLILQDKTMVRNAYDSMDADTDIWIRLEGTGDERVFCAGSQCAD
ncbi:MAG: hypothetical protein CMD33_08870 [Flavobacteriales bacterium]|nr:hypothetical protein [Flavobacteriales bacterium]